VRLIHPTRQESLLSSLLVWRVGNHKIGEAELLDVREALRRAAVWNADRVAIISGDRQFTFTQAWERGLRLANALLSLGLKPGDRVAVLEDNCIEASDFFLGTAAANLVRVPLYKRNSAEAHAHMIAGTGCRAIVVAKEYEAELAGISDTAPELEHIVVRGDDYEDWLSRHSSNDPNPPVTPEDFYVIRHSGGTTGRSKGMAFSHKAWMHTERDWTYRLPPMEVGDACLHVAPISHGSGYLFVPTWISGGYNILEPRFDPGRVLCLIAEHGGFFFAVPTMLNDIVSCGDGRHDFGRLKAIVIAGAPIRPQTALAARAMFGDKLHQFYGQTEAVPATWMTPREWFGETPGSQALLAVGRVMPFVRLEIRDPENRPLPLGEVGEVALQTDGQVEKIWNEPELTAKRLVDGWVLTGDIGRLDRNGYLYLVDRKDDLIISGGFNIWPAELEIVITSLPGVREAVVVSAPHERWGETPVAIVVVNEAAPLSEDDVMQACGERLGGYKKPSKVILQHDPLPRTPVGKISRKNIREAFWEGKSSRIHGS
jgi:acyl-CoA synthetase (AMP-forming)/AMP-acid ligase II